MRANDYVLLEHRVISMYGSYGSECPEQFVRAYYAILWDESLRDIDRSIAAVDPERETPPPARMLLKWIEDNRDESPIDVEGMEKAIREKKETR